MYNYKLSNNIRQHPLSTYSFSNSKQPISIQHRQFTLTSKDRRGLIGWISSILEPQGQEFIHAMNCSNKRNLRNLKTYISKNYPHFKEIVRYYILALLIDYEWIVHLQTPNLKQSNDIFLNKIIEDLAARFYRESQWLTSIMHLPVYQIFGFLDQYSKGYLTIYSLKNYAKLSFEKLEKINQISFQLLDKKLKGNLGGLQSKIYQQNFKELQYRVDLVSFSQKKLQQCRDCSISYAKIYQELNKEIQRQKNIQKRQDQLDYEQKKLAIEDLDINRQDFQIRVLSRSLLEPLKPIQSTAFDKKCMMQQSYVEKQNICESKTLEQTRADLSKINNITNSEQLGSKVMNRMRDVGCDNINDENMKNKQNCLQIEKKNMNLQKSIALKMDILGQLELIRTQKYENRHHLLSFI